MVKWEGQPESENSWINEDSFQSKDTVTQYFSEKRKKKKEKSAEQNIIEVNLLEINNNTKTKKIKNLQTNKDVNYFIKLLVIFSIIMNAQSIKVADNFKYCQSVVVKDK